MERHRLSQRVTRLKCEGQRERGRERERERGGGEGASGKRIGDKE